MKTKAIESKVNATPCNPQDIAHTQGLNEAQAKSYARVKERWTRISEPHYSIGGVAMVECFYSNGHSMWVGIELDGHTHS